ncbi:MAG: hypothetical protein COW04_12940 [Deltaproteobacteria bacterium CG12_big_fil_rev_8_21_14_0_65_43_10]|nr:MAG: hypothetical protein COW04_12940 [Deltaproteobacteria bacterium CG12_big_fil_rev_8_21_14_0_65_43_10]PIU86416.1 MAG: hypothetical protein COS67_02645 [Deltaproteobacteria bacterium CG06_land_8_20_14_3_00_44_19]
MTRFRHFQNSPFLPVRSTQTGGLKHLKMLIFRFVKMGTPKILLTCLRATHRQMFAPKEIFPVCLQAGIFQDELIHLSGRLSIVSNCYILDDSHIVCQQLNITTVTQWEL